MRERVNRSWFLDISVYTHWNICCGYSKELSHWDDSFEFPQHRVRGSNKDFRTCNTPPYLELCILGLTLTHIQTHFDASAEDNFLKHCDKRRNEQFLLCHKSFQLDSLIFLTLTEYCQCFAWILSKSSDAILLYVGKD